MSTRFVGPLFLIGMPRSGTKLLRDLLNRHPQVGIPEIETEFLPWLARRSAVYGDLSQSSSFYRFFSEVTKLPYFIYRTEEGRLISKKVWFDACHDYSPMGVFEALIRVEVGAPVGTERIWGDKSPSYIDDFLLLTAMYPACKILHIVRDVRDYCLSIHKAWRKDMLRAAQRWTDGVEKARCDGVMIGANYMEVRYEDLLSDSEGVLRRICEFLQIQYSADMVHLEKTSENLGDTKGARHVVKTNVGKFLTGIDSQTRLSIEAIAGDSLLRYGYQLEFPRQPAMRLSRRQLFVAQLRDGWNLIRSEQEQRGLIGAARFYLKYFLVTRG